MPKNKVNWAYYLSALAALGLAVYWLINALTQKTNSALENHTALALPDACSNFELTLGNWFNATVILLGERHMQVGDYQAVNPLSFACITALMNARNTFNSNHIYFEATQPPNICKHATRCSSWENVEAYNQIRTVYEESLNLFALSMLYDPVKKINADNKRVLWLQQQLEANKKQPTDDLLKRQSNLIENVLLPAYRKMGGTILSVIDGYFQHAKTLVSPTCDTTPNPKLHFCLQKEATTGRLSKKRNQSLLDKINKEQENKKGSAFFLAGNSHIEAVRPKLGGNNIAILTAKNT